ncbi:uncharacterized protein LOC124535891, partial [Vanessa cardui]|uniref:uncharacterized protein LOC124535891 n=1 Tax=Vanessa cardui TaxID=171605 RepID=UPI001F1464BC
MVKCDFDCAHEEIAPDVLEFVGPVKIVLVDQSKRAYTWKTCYAAMILMAQMLLAITTITVMLFSLSYKKSKCFLALHIFLCTAGLQVIIPSGILTLNNLNGASAPMKPADRKFEHVFMQISGVLFTVSGTASSFYYIFKSSDDLLNFLTIHSCLGLAAIAPAIFCVLLGLCFSGCSRESKPPKEYGKLRRCIYTVHKLFGILVFLLSSACFISGIIKTPFFKWLPIDEMFYFTIMFCVFYTLVIIYKPLK